MAEIKEKEKLKIEAKQQISNQLTTVCSLLTGFSFTAFTVLITSPKRDIFFNLTSIITGISVFVLLSATIIGVALTLACKMLEIYEDKNFIKKVDRLASFFTPTFFTGISLFVLNVILLSFLLNAFVGILCSVIAILTTMLTFYAIKITILKL